jgi:hypothetical protein
MFKKEAVVFILLAVGVALALTGVALVSRGTSEGWVAVLIAAPMLFVAQRSMRVAKTHIDTRPNE